MQIVRNKWMWLLGLVLALYLGWWLFGPQNYELHYLGHKFEFLEPLSKASTDREARLTVWVGYQGQRPRWWGQKVNSRVEEGHQWSFSNGPDIKSSGAFPALAEYNAAKDCYEYWLEKGLTAYSVQNGAMVAVESGLATRCRLSIMFFDPQNPRSASATLIPMTLDLKEGLEIFKPVDGR